MEGLKKGTASFGNSDECIESSAFITFPKRISMGRVLRKVASTNEEESNECAVHVCYMQTQKYHNYDMSTN